MNLEGSTSKSQIRPNSQRCINTESASQDTCSEKRQPSIGVEYPMLVPRILNSLRVESANLLTAFGISNACIRSYEYVKKFNPPKMHHGVIVLVTGPSGCGKSQLLPALVSQIEPPKIPTVETADHTRALIDAWDIEPAKVVARLSAFGLGDPITWCRLPSQLSVGQMARFRLADLVCSAGDLVVVDNYLDGLDSVTAYAVAHATGKAVRSVGKTLIAVCPRPDFEPHLQPDIHLELSFEGDVKVHLLHERSGRSLLLEDSTVAVGSPVDWQRMKPLHYAAGNPATIKQVYTATLADDDKPCAVLVLSYADLQSYPRNLATKGRYLRGSARDRAKKVNAEVARISRIVVSPELRGCGFASALIRHVAAVSGLKYIEISTAMGPYSGFLEKAGFKRIPTEPSKVETEWRSFARWHSLDARVALNPADLPKVIGNLSVREARRGRSLVWRLYHHLVLHRRTRQPVPKRVPAQSSEHWKPAYELAANRVSNEPAYYIMPTSPTSLDDVAVGDL